MRRRINADRSGIGAPDAEDQLPAAGAFVGNDIDRVAAQMCYIQLSLLGCPGYIAVTDTLTNPITGPVIQPNEKPDQEFWFMPMYWSDPWTMRRLKEYYKRKGEI